MIFIRRSQDRGKSQLNWLTSFHTFSFANYYDPKFMGFGNLRVINEDTVQPGHGFSRHPHGNMEIISYVVEGSLEHKDSMGTGSIIKPGEIQMMTAGTGVEHSEFNHSKEELLHFLQIWIIPDRQGLAPSYQQKTIHKTNNEFILIGSPRPHENAILIHQDVNLYAVFLMQHQVIHYVLKDDRGAWLQLIQGKIKLNEHELVAGDGAAIHNEKIEIQGIEPAEFLFFDLSTS